MYVCGKCGCKEEMIKKGEGLKLKMVKKQFDICIGDDETCDSWQFLGCGSLVKSLDRVS